MNYQIITVEEFCNDNRVQLHKFHDSELYFVYNKVSCTVFCYKSLDDEISGFLFGVNKHGVNLLDPEMINLVKEIYSEHQ